MGHLVGESLSHRPICLSLHLRSPILSLQNNHAISYSLSTDIRPSLLQQPILLHPSSYPFRFRPYSINSIIVFIDLFHLSFRACLFKFSSSIIGKAKLDIHNKMWHITLIFVSLLAVFPGTIAKAEASIAAPKLFSEICVAWHLSASNIVGKGWIFSGFCKNSAGIYAWDDNNLLDDCVGTDDDGRLTHDFYGEMSQRCSECNNNDGWGHTSSIDHALVCNCTNAQGGTVESNLDLDTTYGYWDNHIGCLATPASPAKPPSMARDLWPYGHASVVSSPLKTPTPFSNGGPSYTSIVPTPTSTPFSNGNSSFASNCGLQFQVTGNLQHPGFYDPTVMWAECVDSQGLWEWTSLDIGLCFGDSHGSLVPQQFGLFNETCFNCLQEIDVLPATLLCHCPNDPVFNKSTTYNATTIPIEPTIQAIDGMLSCFGMDGERGLLPPSEFLVPEWNTPAADKDHQLPARTSSEESLEHASQQFAKTLAARTEDAHQDHCCFWESCSNPITMRQPEPWLFTRCRKIHDESPTTVARFDLSKAFRYDRSDWTIKPGDGLYDNGNGCKDCHTGGSWMYCQCPQADGNFTVASIDLNDHISNINGTLCSSSYCGDHEAPTAPIQGVW
ncbi:hypothetical protein CONLIGDRAFT_701256 [Coniochaeta ligniaria NRRL 30616]|uniref:Cyanovirin-N domain-containing protein n=1 Tax=Coniochaeta ligniaria NRRL 30616 TaxID=1408157 RepID=A0A1J7IUT7_9PEZI|nr:hypothetical protein CONLIGDRAFT_701256 [Coniochaeta ligniaria NRRL 30616]